MLAAGDGIHLSTYGHEKYAEWIGDYMLSEFEWKELHLPSEDTSAPEASSAPETSDDADASESASAPAADASAAESEVEKSGLSAGVIAAIAAAAVVVVGGIALLLAKRKKK